MRGCGRIFGVVAAALFGVLSAPVLAQSDLDPLAKKLAGKLKAGPARILVAGFLDARGLRSPLGVQLASDFAGALLRVSPELELVPTEEFSRVRKQELWTESDVRNLSVLRGLAQGLGARLLITGNYERQRKSLRLSVLAFDFQKSKQAARASLSVPLTAERARLDEQVFSLRRREKDLEPPPTSGEYTGPVLRPGKDGVGVPECRQCPLPAAPPEARAKKFVRSVILRIVVTPEGLTANIRVVKGQKYGLTEAAVKAVERWRFKPARQSGKPVAVEILIEVDFRMT